MDWSMIIDGALAAYGAYSTWRARKHKKEAIAAKAEAAKAKADAAKAEADFKAISREANRLGREQDLAEQARLARERAGR